MPPVLDASMSRRLGALQLQVDLELGEEVGVLFGPSGSGKTQTLRMLAGLAPTDSGQILLRGRDITHSPPARRGVGMVFQELSLFPHMTALDNIAYGVRGPRRLQEARRWLDRVQLEACGDRLPHQLSGGQRQRVALARALAPGPDLLLLDEPFSALDGPLRRSLRRVLKRLHRETGTPVLYVTHQVEDLCALGDKVFFLRSGQVAASLPVEKLWDPASQSAAWGSLGWGTLVAGVVGPCGDGIALSWGAHRLVLPPATTVRGPAQAFIAPHSVKLLYPDMPVAPQLAMNILEGQVEERLELGSVVRVTVAAADLHWHVEFPPGAYGGLWLAEGMPVKLAVRPKDISILEAEE